MKRSLKKFRKGLEKENRQLFDKIILNIDSYSLNSIQREEIYEELLGMFLESENRNEYLSLVIGPDVNEFCKELTKNAKRKTTLEKIINLLYYASLSIFYFNMFIVSFDIITKRYSQAYFNDGSLYISIFSIINYISIGAIIIIFQQLNSRSIFNKKIKSIIVIIYIIIFTTVSMVLNELLDKNKFITINAVPYFITVALITLGLWCLDKYIAKKNYYN